jgi:proteic killer suppression protein
LNISFRNGKLEKEINEGVRLDRVHGALRAQKIRLRMAVLRAAANLMVFWPPKSGPDRCHELTGGKRKGQLSVDLDHPYRLIFIPDHDPIPVREDGGLDWSQVTAIKIMGIENTHE